MLAPSASARCSAWLSAVLYTCTNACLRVVVNHDPYWVSCLKAVPTMLLAAAILLYDRSRGVRHPLSLKLAVGLFLSGVLDHFGGNVCLSMGLGNRRTRGDGAAHLQLGSHHTVHCSAAFGSVKPITGRTVAAIAFLSAAFLCVSVHTREAARARRSRTDSPSPRRPSSSPSPRSASRHRYAVLGAVMREPSPARPACRAPCSWSAIAGCSPSAGGGRTGRHRHDHRDPDRDYGVIARRRLFNAVAFFALTRAMQLVPVSFVNIVNASQVAMAAVAGVVLFQEPQTAWLYGGIVLTVAAS